MNQQLQPQLATTVHEENPDKLPLLSVPSQDGDGRDELLALLDDSSAKKKPATAHEFPPVLSNQDESQNEASSGGHSGNSNLQACRSSHDHVSIHEKTDNNNGQNEEEDSNSFLGDILQAEEQANNRSLTGGSGALSRLSFIVPNCSTVSIFVRVYRYLCYYRTGGSGSAIICWCSEIGKYCHLKMDDKHIFLPLIHGLLATV